MARALLASVAAVALLAASAEAAVLTSYSEISAEFGFDIQQKWNGAGSTIFAYTDPGTYSSPSCVAPHTFVEAHPGYHPHPLPHNACVLFRPFRLVALAPNRYADPNYFASSFCMDGVAALENRAAVTWGSPVSVGIGEREAGTIGFVSFDTATNVRGPRAISCSFAAAPTY